MGDIRHMIYSAMKNQFSILSKKKAKFDSSNKKNNSTDMNANKKKKSRQNPDKVQETSIRHEYRVVQQFKFKVISRVQFMKKLPHHFFEAAFTKYATKSIGLQFNCARGE
uniref:Uncharacterized protein n=1 Tax=Lactuca sativa TaxID=4236 RepID=A0A9R1WCV2_LACSA|nr:hypothetical protein LSAT_V11C200051660 [Lactuca sativa]